MSDISKYPKEMLLGFYEKMVRARKFEETAADCFTKGMLAGNIHLGIGQEGCMVGAISSLKETDFVTTTHRGHGQGLCKGSNTNKFMAELFGKKTGYCKGKGGSMHIVDFERGNLGANGIIGASIPIATGSALASKINGDNHVTMCIFGDATSNQGTFHEAINMAAAWKLPIVYVIENNGYGVSVPIHKVTNTETLSVRAKGYNIPGATIDGEDVINVYETISKAVERARKGEGPSLIEVIVYRWQGHYCGDPASYRPKEYMEEAHKKDPIKLFNERLISEKIATKKELDDIEKKIVDEMATAVDFAVKSEYPDPSEAFTDVYAVDNGRCVER
ncbi:MAG: thiamine pyrophosphate-dependent dehydrogenase E1 component subunit alpha [Elusimicrobiota bacterium]|jgi:pyruvate dehydrogenase E1 component alpha subunit|nr:thiamine pyrophosphate-dependent dehydrogenase E1 component subunit alpha [Elusimicrobiota bacterium]